MLKIIPCSSGGVNPANGLGEGTGDAEQDENEGKQGNELRHDYLLVFGAGVCSGGATMRR
jgi:hypothetical protein